MRERVRVHASVSIYVCVCVNLISLAAATATVLRTFWDFFRLFFQIAYTHTLTHNNNLLNFVFPDFFRAAYSGCDGDETMVIAVVVAATATTAFLFALLLFNFLKNSYEIRMCWTVFRKRLFSNCLLSRERKNKTTWKKWISFILHTCTNYTHAFHIRNIAHTHTHKHDHCKCTCEWLNACTLTHIHMTEGTRRWPFVRVSTKLWISKIRKHDSKWKLDCVQSKNKGKTRIHFCVPHLVYEQNSNL